MLWDRENGHFSLSLSLQKGSGGYCTGGKLDISSISNLGTGERIISSAIQTLRSFSNFISQQYVVLLLFAGIVRLL